MATRKTGVQNLNNTSEIRRELSRCVGKICAYRNVGNDAMSKEWAATIVTTLRKHGLL